MAKTFDERALFDSDQQELCCNYAAWEEGNYSCDLYLGTMTAPELADEYGAAYLFISAYDEKEESWDQDFGPETNSVEAILNIVTAIDLCQDLAGVALGYYVKGFWPLLIIAIPMLIGDLYALYLVSLDRPFLFFDSPFLEKYILWQIMALDIIFDFIFFAVFLIFSDF